jgi:hypothetical protein
VLQARVEEQDAPSHELREFTLAAESGNKFDAKEGNRKSADESSCEADATMSALDTIRAMSRQADRAYMNEWDLFFSDEIVDAFACCFALRLS